MRKYNIKTIDLESFRSRQDVFKAFSRELNLSNYDDNDWEALWISITGLVEIPTNLILYNYQKFSEACKSDSEKLTQLINQYNTKNGNLYNKDKGSSIIQLDYLDELIKNKIETIFKRRPAQFGLRGDVPMWNNLEKFFIGAQIPEDEDDLIRKIHDTMVELTGNSTDHQENHYVKEYDSGGQFGGGISWSFWERRGIPLLIGRYRSLKQIASDKSSN